MLSATSQISELYEGLQGYILGGRKRGAPPPDAVPSTRPSDPRLPSRPEQPPKYAKRPIPTSSQQPANRKPNQRVPYARYMHSWPDDTAAPTDLQSGDVVFVHKTSQALGHGTSRMIKVTGIPQLNAMLQKGSPGYATLSLDGNGVRERIKELRVLRARDKLAARAAEAIERGVSVEDYAPYTAQTAALDSCEKLYAAALTVASINPYEDWEAVTLLKDWTPDGVLISIDDDSLEVEAPRDARNDGVLLNVAIAGPTPLRNSAWQIDKLPERNAWAPQIIDDGALALDKVFVGLFVEEVRQPDKVGVLVGWKYKYKLFTSRQILAMGIMDNSMNDGYYRLNQATPAMFAQGPSEDEFRRLAAAWRIGSITDTRLSQDPQRLVTLNVVIERWDIERIRHEFGQAVGNSLAPLVMGPLAPYAGGSSASKTVPAPAAPPGAITPAGPSAPSPSPGALHLEVQNTIDLAIRQGMSEPYYNLLSLNQYLTTQFSGVGAVFVVEELLDAWREMVQTDGQGTHLRANDLKTLWNALLYLPNEHKTYIEDKMGDPAEGFMLLNTDFPMSKKWKRYATEIASINGTTDAKMLSDYEFQWLRVALEYMRVFNGLEPLVGLQEEIMLEQNNKYRELLEA